MHYSIRKHIRSFCRLANRQRSTRILYSLGLDDMSSHRRRLLWTLTHFLSVFERLARTYFSIQHWHAVPDLCQMVTNRLCYARATE
jgi:hypothetical protein